MGRLSAIKVQLELELELEFLYCQLDSTVIFYFHDEFHSSLCFHLTSLLVTNAMRSICDVISKGNLDASYNGFVLLSLVMSISCPCHNGHMREDFSPVYSLACVRSVLVMLIISFLM